MNVSLVTPSLKVIRRGLVLFFTAFPNLSSLEIASGMSLPITVLTRSRSWVSSPGSLSPHGWCRQCQASLGDGG